MILQSIPSGAFTELPLLQSTELQENRIQEIASNAFINVPHLLFLNLSHNHLPDLEYVGLESLRSLEVLDLSYNRLSRVSNDSLAAMEWLVELKVFTENSKNSNLLSIFKRQNITSHFNIYILHYLNISSRDDSHRRNLKQHHL